ncbi:uncharacterized protein MONBRDRAFT_8855 [Monosiga brevicollis MX1]|uniref:EGF-like domain-containing protein n=1 Tax=Monosiga brevicollis TaxID=81824 RepID=A9V1B9_MONBE|nr:uncharacterized protein MONBRDRAFT_8855 [Monosiga brevicollis MX1]EDQ88904.1 predicted protein [Monosiga brevicollis MX1]|eukprot:XP_001746517.1 hypothetical protein [Monosiga brevicollis MX1]
MARASPTSAMLRLGLLALVGLLSASIPSQATQVISCTDTPAACQAGMPQAAVMEQGSLHLSIERPAWTQKVSSAVQLAARAKWTDGATSHWLDLNGVHTSHGEAAACNVSQQGNTTITTAALNLATLTTNVTHVAGVTSVYDYHIETTIPDALVGINDEGADLTLADLTPLEQTTHLLTELTTDLASSITLPPTPTIAEMAQAVQPCAESDICFRETSLTGLRAASNINDVALTVLFKLSGPVNVTNAWSLASPLQAGTWQADDWPIVFTSSSSSYSTGESTPTYTTMPVSERDLTPVNVNDATSTFALQCTLSDALTDDAMSKAQLFVPLDAMLDVSVRVDHLIGASTANTTWHAWHATSQTAVHRIDTSEATAPTLEVTCASTCPLARSTWVALANMQTQLGTTGQPVTLELSWDPTLDFVARVRRAAFFDGHTQTHVYWQDGLLRTERFFLDLSDDTVALEHGALLLSDSDANVLEAFVLSQHVWSKANAAISAPASLLAGASQTATQFSGWTLTALETSNGPEQCRVCADLSTGPCLAASHATWPWQSTPTCKSQRWCRPCSDNIWTVERQQIVVSSTVCGTLESVNQSHLDLSLTHCDGTTPLTWALLGSTLQAHTPWSLALQAMWASASLPSVRRVTLHLMEMDDASNLLAVTPTWVLNAEQCPESWELQRARQGALWPISGAICVQNQTWAVTTSGELDLSHGAMALGLAAATDARLTLGDSSVPWHSARIIRSLTGYELAALKLAPQDEPQYMHVRVANDHTWHVVELSMLSANPLSQVLNQVAGRASTPFAPERTSPSLCLLNSAFAASIASSDCVVALEHVFSVSDGWMSTQQTTLNLAGLDSGFPALDVYAAGTSHVGLVGSDARLPASDSVSEGKLVTRGVRRNNGVLFDAPATACGIDLVAPMSWQITTRKSWTVAEGTAMLVSPAMDAATSVLLPNWEADVAPRLSATCRDIVLAHVESVAWAEASTTTMHQNDDNTIVKLEQSGTLIEVHLITDPCTLVSVTQTTAATDSTLARISTVSGNEAGPHLQLARGCATGNRLSNGISVNTCATSTLDDVLAAVAPNAALPWASLLQTHAGVVPSEVETLVLYNDSWFATEGCWVDGRPFTVAFAAPAAAMAAPPPSGLDARITWGGVSGVIAAYSAAVVEADLHYAGVTGFGAECTLSTISGNVHCEAPAAVAATRTINELRTDLPPSNAPAFDTLPFSSLRQVELLQIPSAEKVDGLRHETWTVSGTVSAAQLCIKGSRACWPCSGCQARVTSETLGSAVLATRIDIERTTHPTVQITRREGGNATLLLGGRPGVSLPLGFETAWNPLAVDASLAGVNHSTSLASSAAELLPAHVYAALGRDADNIWLAELNYSGMPALLVNTLSAPAIAGFLTSVRLECLRPTTSTTVTAQRVSYQLWVAPSGLLVHGQRVVQPAHGTGQITSAQRLISDGAWEDDDAALQCTLRWADTPFSPVTLVMPAAMETAETFVASTARASFLGWTLVCRDAMSVITRWNLPTPADRAAWLDPIRLAHGSTLTDMTEAYTTIMDALDAMHTMHDGPFVVNSALITGFNGLRPRLSNAAWETWSADVLVDGGLDWRGVTVSHCALKLTHINAMTAARVECALPLAGHAKVSLTVTLDAERQLIGTHTRIAVRHAPLDWPSYDSEIRMIVAALAENAPAPGTLNSNTKFVDYTLEAPSQGNVWEHVCNIANEELYCQTTSEISKRLSVTNGLCTLHQSLMAWHYAPRAAASTMAAWPYSIHAYQLIGPVNAAIAAHYPVTPDLFALSPTALAEATASASVNTRTIALAGATSTMEVRVVKRHTDAFGNAHADTGLVLRNIKWDRYGDTISGKAQSAIGSAQFTYKPLDSTVRVILQPPSSMALIYHGAVVSATDHGVTAYSSRVLASSATQKYYSLNNASKVLLSQALLTELKHAADDAFLHPILEGTVLVWSANATYSVPAATVHEVRVEAVRPAGWELILNGVAFDLGAALVTLHINASELTETVQADVWLAGTRYTATTISKKARGSNEATGVTMELSQAEPRVCTNRTLDAIYDALQQDVRTILDEIDLDLIGSACLQSMAATCYEHPQDGACNFVDVNLTVQSQSPVQLWGLQLEAWQLQLRIVNDTDYYSALLTGHAGPVAYELAVGNGTVIWRRASVRGITLDNWHDSPWPLLLATEPHAAWPRVRELGGWGIHANATDFVLAASQTTGGDNTSLVVRPALMASWLDCTAQVDLVQNSKVLSSQHASPPGVTRRGNWRHLTPHCRSRGYRHEWLQACLMSTPLCINTGTWWIETSCSSSAVDRFANATRVVGTLHAQMASLPALPFFTAGVKASVFTNTASEAYDPATMVAEPVGDTSRLHVEGTDPASGMTVDLWDCSTPHCDNNIPLTRELLHGRTVDAKTLDDLSCSSAAFVAIRNLPTPLAPADLDFNIFLPEDRACTEQVTKTDTCIGWSAYPWILADEDMDGPCMRDVVGNWCFALSGAGTVASPVLPSAATNAVVASDDNSTLTVTIEHANLRDDTLIALLLGLNTIDSESLTVVLDAPEDILSTQQLVARLQADTLGPRTVLLHNARTCMQETVVVAATALPAYAPDRIERNAGADLHLRRANHALLTKAELDAAAQSKTLETVHIWTTVSHSEAASDVGALATRLIVRGAAIARVVVYGRSNCNSSCQAGQLDYTFNADGTVTISPIDAASTPSASANVALTLAVPAALVPGPFSDVVRLGNTSVARPWTAPLPTLLLGGSLESISSFQPLQARLTELDLDGFAFENWRWELLQQKTAAFLRFQAKMPGPSATVYFYFTADEYLYNNVTKPVAGAYGWGSVDVGATYCLDVRTDTTPDCAAKLDMVLDFAPALPLSRARNLSLAVDALASLNGTVLSSLSGRANDTDVLSLVRATRTHNVWRPSDRITTPQIVDLTFTEPAPLFPAPSVGAPESATKTYIMPAESSLMAKRTIEREGQAGVNAYTLEGAWRLGINQTFAGQQMLRYVDVTYAAVEKFNVSTGLPESVNVIHATCDRQIDIPATEYCPAASVSACASNLTFATAYRMLSGAELADQEAASLPIADLTIIKESSTNSNVRVPENSDQSWMHHHLDDLQIVYNQEAQRLEEATMTRTYTHTRGACPITNAANVAGVIDPIQWSPGIMFCKWTPPEDCQGFACEPTVEDCFASSSFAWYCEAGFTITGHMRYVQASDSYEWKYSASGRCNQCLTASGCTFTKLTSATSGKLVWPASASSIYAAPRILLMQNITFDTKLVLSTGSRVTMNQYNNPSTFDSSWRSLDYTTGSKNNGFSKGSALFSPSNVMNTIKSSALKVSADLIQVPTVTFDLRLDLTEAVSFRPNHYRVEIQGRVLMPSQGELMWKYANVDTSCETDVYRFGAYGSENPALDGVENMQRVYVRNVEFVNQYKWRWIRARVCVGYYNTVDNISENENCSPFFDPAVPFMYKRVKGAAISLSSDYNNFYVGYQGDADSTAGKLLSKESGILTRIVPIDVDGRKANFLVSVAQMDPVVVFVDPSNPERKTAKVRLEAKHFSVTFVSGERSIAEANKDAVDHFEFGDGRKLKLEEFEKLKDPTGKYYELTFSTPGQYAMWYGSLFFCEVFVAHVTHTIADTVVTYDGFFPLPLARSTAMPTTSLSLPKSSVFYRLFDSASTFFASPIHKCQIETATENLTINGLLMPEYATAGVAKTPFEYTFQCDTTDEDKAPQSARAQMQLQVSCNNDYSDQESCTTPSSWLSMLADPFLTPAHGLSRTDSFYAFQEVDRKIKSYNQNIACSFKRQKKYHAMKQLTTTPSHTLYKAYLEDAKTDYTKFEIPTGLFYCKKAKDLRAKVVKRLQEMEEKKCKALGSKRSALQNEVLKQAIKVCFGDCGMNVLSDTRRENACRDVAILSPSLLKVAPLARPTTKTCDPCAAFLGYDTKTKLSEKKCRALSGCTWRSSGMCEHKSKSYLCSRNAQPSTTDVDRYQELLPAFYRYRADASSLSFRLPRRRMHIHPNPWNDNMKYLCYSTKYTKQKTGSGYLKPEDTTQLMYDLPGTTSSFDYCVLDTDFMFSYETNLQEKVNGKHIYRSFWNRAPIVPPLMEAFAMDISRPIVYLWSFSHKEFELMLDQERSVLNALAVHNTNIQHINIMIFPKGVTSLISTSKKSDWSCQQYLAAVEANLNKMRRLACDQASELPNYTVRKELPK